MGEPVRIGVLIAEDDYLVRKMIIGELERLGHYVVVGEASDGLEAVEMVNSLRPDVVLMDINMPDVNGIEATRRIHDCCPTPVVVLTAYETPELVRQAGSAGVGAYLLKPPNAHEMDRAITIAMARFDDMMKLRRLNEELDAYAHTVAHELKNPLSSIILYADLLKEQTENLTPEKQGRFLQGIMRTAYRMRNIINELLLLANVRQEGDVETSTIDMQQIISNVRQALDHMVQESGAELILPDEWPETLGHPPWVEEVWTNYISNAIKYGGQPPRLELGATPQQDGFIRFWVRDNGPGLTQEEQHRLFASPTEERRPAKIHIKGHGLGLSIVQRIVERLGGQVGVESEGVPGKGSLFYFSLPRSAPPP